MSNGCEPSDGQVERNEKMSTASNAMTDQPMNSREVAEAMDTGFPGPAVDLAARKDVLSLAKSHISYDTSWKKRGGVGAFMMLARKWDRLENAVKKHGYDIFKTVEGDKRAEGIMDDIRDLRRYLLLVEAEVGGTVPEVKK